MDPVLVTIVAVCALLFLLWILILAACDEFQIAKNEERRRRKPLAHHAAPARFIVHPSYSTVSVAQHQRESSGQDWSGSSPSLPDCAVDSQGYVYCRDSETGRYHQSLDGEGGHRSVRDSDGNPLIARDGDGYQRGVYGEELLYHIRD